MSELNGILCINKPEGFTSFDVVAKLRGILKTRRLGHAGTLDPMATGVLPVFAGLATKACDILPDSDKTYEAGFRLGVTTDTQDSTGKTLCERSAESITAQDIENALTAFRGDILQLPPMFSAVQVNGQRLYDLARKGIEVERTPRPVTVYEAVLLEYTPETRTGKLRISCSKGTYIRTILHDLGEVLSCGGIMTKLVRTKAAGFTLSDCTTFEELQKMNGDFSGILLPIEKLFADLPAVWLDEEQTRLYKNGVKLDLARLNLPEIPVRCAVYGMDKFLGTAKPDFEQHILRCEKNFFNR